MTQVKFARFMQSEVKRWDEVLKRVGVTAYLGSACVHRCSA